MFLDQEGGTRGVGGHQGDHSLNIRFCGICLFSIVFMKPDFYLFWGPHT